MFQHMLDAAGYAGKLQVDRIVTSPTHKPSKAFIIEKLDSSVVTYFIAHDPRERLAHDAPYLALGSFQHNENWNMFDDYPVLEDMATNAWLRGKDSTDIHIYHDCPEERVVPARWIHIKGLSSTAALEILGKWLRIYHAEQGSVISQAGFSVKQENWPRARKWLTDGYPGPWVFDNIGYSRGREEDVEVLITRGVAADCLVPLCYWRASQGPRLLLDGVANSDGTWELWVHGAKAMGLKAAATVRAELSATTGIPDLFPPHQDFPWGGCCDFIVGW
jgi:hypothetical protein